jgi:hypothetical protein
MVLVYRIGDPVSRRLVRAYQNYSNWSSTGFGKDDPLPLIYPWCLVTMGSYSIIIFPLHLLAEIEIMAEALMKTLLKNLLTE